MSGNPSQVLEATEGFATEIDGEQFIVNRRTTRVSADHILAKTYPHFFRPVEENLSFQTEEMTSDPGGAPRSRPAPSQQEETDKKPASRTTNAESKENN